MKRKPISQAEYTETVKRLEGSNYGFCCSAKGYGLFFLDTREYVINPEVAFSTVERKITELGL